MSTPSLLEAHAEELWHRAQNGEITYTAFLTPREQHLLYRALPFARDAMLPQGGYADAERQRLLFLPPYMTDAEPELRAEWLRDTLGELVIPLRISGSGFRELSHRDYLGAILNLGIERSALGDLCICDPHSAILFCDRVMCTFLCEHLTRVANDAVHVTEAELPADFNGGRQFRPIRDTVASPRLDSVVAALTNLSRERAQQLLREGLVELDYESADKPDKPVEEGAILTVRGKGKFVIRSLSEQTKKGRIRLAADQYL